MKLHLIRFELLTIKQMRGNASNSETKAKAISARVLELEELISQTKNEIGGALK